MNNLELQQKIYDFEIILYGYLKKFPQSEKFAMTTEIKKTVFEFYKLIYKASKLENKKTSFGHLISSMDAIEKIQKQLDILENNF